jgi:hypothetical protein
MTNLRNGAAGVSSFNPNYFYSFDFWWFPVFGSSIFIMRPTTLVRTTLRRQSISSIRVLTPGARPIPRPQPIPPIRQIHQTAIRLNATPQKPKQCPSCGSHLAPAASPCPSCKALVPIPSDVSYYALFDLVPSGSTVEEGLTRMEGGGYVLDVRDLRMRYLKRQQGCHPDSYTGQGKVSPWPQSEFARITYRP